MGTYVNGTGVWFTQAFDSAGRPTGIFLTGPSTPGKPATVSRKRRRYSISPESDALHVSLTLRHGDGVCRGRDTDCYYSEVRVWNTSRYETFLAGRNTPSYCSFAYSAFACLRMGMFESASFHNVRKS